MGSLLLFNGLLQTIVTLIREFARRLGDCKTVRAALGALAADAAGDLDVLGLDCDPLGVDGLQVAVLKEVDEVRLGRLLQRDDRLRLPALPLREARAYPTV